MKEYPALVKLFANGKVTIPIEIREKLGLKDGELLEIKIAKSENALDGTRALEVCQMADNEHGADSIYAFCYEGNRQIVTDRDEERTGAPCCDGNCERCPI
jgi:AbrB family looped-hinge helix DNA binding protein